MGINVQIQKHCYGLWNIFNMKNMVLILTTYSLHNMHSNRHKVIMVSVLSIIIKVMYSLYPKNTNIRRIIGHKHYILLMYSFHYLFSNGLSNFPPYNFCKKTNSDYQLKLQNICYPDVSQSIHLKFNI
jgi:hypothetical protein